MTGDNAQAYDDDDLIYEHEDRIVQSESRWEKGVEFALARELQAWHVVAQMKAQSDLWSGQNPLYNPTQQEYLRLVAQRCREPRYLPMDGNAERTLGDALASTSIGKLLLIECKEALDGSGWEREAQDEIKTVSDAGKVSISNRGGKNRMATLDEVKAVVLDLPEGLTTIQKLGAQCHVLVGEGAVSEGDEKNLRLAFANYWDFIYRPGGKDFKGQMENFSIKDLQEQGLELEQFRSYVYALLLASDRTTSGDAGWIGRELILLAYGINRETNVSGWIGGRILASTLMKILEMDEDYHNLLDWVVAREDAEEAARKQKDADQRKALRQTKNANAESGNEVKINKYKN